ncbi:MAG: antibiotic biosynthesis monooxygenase [Acidobacteriota bacterium]|nr:antibiotic biosynthesis monooxygenase [Acidobacteriota bacterium]
MITFTVRLTFEEGDRDGIADLVQKLTPPSRQEPGCVNYIAHFVEGEPATVLIYEQYVDETALEHHRNSPHFHQYAAGGLYKLKHTRQLEHLNVIDLNEA